MLVSIDLFVLIPFMLVSFASIGGMAMFFFDFKRFAPEAFTFRAARKARKGIVCLHYANGSAEYLNPRFEHDVTDGYMTVKKGLIKFVPMDAEMSERLGGDLPVLHYFTNLLEPVSMVMCAHLDIFVKELARQGYDVRGSEKILFYCMMSVLSAQENVLIEKSKTWTQMTLTEQTDEIIARLEKTLTEIDVNDEATRGKLREVMRFIMKNRDELEMIVRASLTRPFSIRTAMQGIENLFGFTSANYYNTKNQIEAFARSERKGSDYQVFLYVGIAALAICGGVYLLTK